MTPAKILHLTTTDISLELLLGPQLQAFVEAGHEVVGVSAPGPFVEALEARGVRHVALQHSTRAMDLRSDLRAMREFHAIVRRLRPDIVHTHNPKPGVYGRLAARAARVPGVVNTVHGLYATADDRMAKRGVVYGLERLAAACSDAELVQNPEDLDQLRRLRVPSDRLHLLGNGVDLGRFAPRPDERAAVRAELGFGDDDIVIGAVGRLVWEKGYRELFTAAAELRSSDPAATLVVVGPHEPDKADAVDAESRTAATEAGVRFLGHREDVERLYQAFDVYVLASHREGFPRSAMEAAASGVPVVATDIRGCRQVVDDERTGLLVPTHDPAALAAALRTLVRHQGTRSDMSAAGLAKAQRDFDQQRQIGLTLEVYERLLHR